MSTLVLSEARLGGRRLLAQVERRVVSLSRERTVSGASSVTMSLRDGGLELVRSGVLAKGTELIAWGQRWRCVGFDAGDDRSVEVAFESARVNDLKRDFRRMRMRGTRPQFTKAIAGAARPRIPVTIPDSARLAGPRVGSFGIGLGARDVVRINNRAATREQRVTLDAVLGAAFEAGANVATMRALTSVMIVETSALNVVASAADRGGVLRMPLALAPRVQARDLAAIGAWFVTEAGAGLGSPDTIAASVMRRSASRYAGVAAQAAAIVTTFMRNDVSRIAQATALVRRHLVGKLRLGVGAPHGEANESRWDAITRVWGEIGWYVFEVANGLVVMSGQHAKVAKPELVLDPDDAGVIRMSAATDEGFLVDRVSAVLHEETNDSIRPGMVVDVVAFGEASGRYVVTSERRTAGSPLIDVDLESPQPVIASQNRATPARASSASGDAPANALSSVRLGSAWSGTESIFDQFVTPFLRRYGLQPGSQKRQTQNTANGGTSDHWVGSTSSYAIDYPTFSGERAARDLAQAMGAGSWSSNSYGTFNVTVGGKRFRVQILWGSRIDHGDHVHVGIRRL